MTSIYDIERYCFTGTDMLQSLQHIRDDGKITAGWLIGETNKKITYKRYKEFNNQLMNDMKKVLVDLGM